MLSRREDAFKEGLGGIQEELMRTRKHTMRFIIRFLGGQSALKPLHKRQINWELVGPAAFTRIKTLIP